MRRTRSTFMLLAGTAVAVALVAGCSSSSKSSSGSSSSGGASSSGSSAPSNLPASITFDAVQNLTGVAGKQGTSTKQGMQVAIDEINNTKYLGNTKLSIDVKDDASMAANGSSLMTQIVAGDSPVVFGSISSNIAVAEAPIAQRAKVPTIFTQAGSPGIVDAGDYIYRATPVQTSYVKLTAQYMQKQGFKNVGMLYVTDVPTITSIATFFQQNASQYGYNLVDTEQTTSTTTDLSAPITKIVAKKPDAVILMALSGQNPTAVSQLRSAGYTGTIIGQQGMGGGVLSSLGDSATNIFWSTDFNPQQTNTGAAHFSDLYTKAYGTPNNFAAEGYDAIWLAARALKDANSVDRTAVLASLSKVSTAGFQGALGDVKWVDRDEVASGVLVEWTGGKEVLAPTS